MDAPIIQLGNHTIKMPANGVSQAGRILLEAKLTQWDLRQDHVLFSWVMCFAVMWSRARPAAFAALLEISRRSAIVKKEL